MFNLKSLVRLLLLSVAVAMFSYTSAMAFDHAIGSRGLNAGALPPAENQKLVYVLYNHYYTSTVTDSDGDDTPIDVDVAGQCHRFIYFPGAKLFGADYLANLALPYANAHVDTPWGKESNTGLIDPFFEPFTLHWSKPNWEIIFGVGFCIPMGSNDLSKNHWTVMPQSAITYYPTKDRKWNFSIVPAFEFHSENLEEDDYTEGDDFHFEWGIGRQFGPVNVGIVGYDQWQISDDDGYRESGMPITKDSELHAIGVAAQFPSKFLGGLIDVSYWHEYKAENENKGDRVWITFVKPL